MTERVSHEKREGNCRIVYFPGTDSENAGLWNHEDCPVCRAEKAERELDEARPVLEAARAQTERHTAAGVKAHLALLIVSGHSCQCGLCMAVRAYDAARAAVGGEDE